MTRALVLAALLLPALGAARDAAGPGSRVPRGVHDEARAKKEIQELYLAFIEAGEKGDADGAAALIDFPLLVATDGATGAGVGQTWTRERWLETLAPAYDSPDREAKVSRKAIVFLVSDSLATVSLTTTVERRGGKGAEKRTERSGAVLIRTADEWRIKALVESGWLDVVPPPPESEEAPAAPPSGAARSPSADGAASPAAKDEAAGDEPREPREPPREEGR